VPGVEELGAGDPVEVARENARRKACAVDGPLVLGVDTLVHLDAGIYGKPAGEDDAGRMLRALSGRTHEVVSGLALRRGGAEPDLVHAITRVSFRTVTDALLRWYLDTGEWRERAGAYAIQGRGAALVSGIEGDYLNVVGLPVAALLDLEPGLLPRSG
jgi:septum formation protein